MYSTDVTCLYSFSEAIFTPYSKIHWLDAVAERDIYT